VVGDFNIASTVTLNGTISYDTMLSLLNSPTDVWRKKNPNTNAVTFPLNVNCTPPVQE
jgi:hypothetical protein